MGTKKRIPAIKSMSTRKQKSTRLLRWAYLFHNSRHIIANERATWATLLIWVWHGGKPSDVPVTLWGTP